MVVVVELLCQNNIKMLAQPMIGPSYYNSVCNSVGQLMVKDDCNANGDARCTEEECEEAQPLSKRR